MKQTMIQIHFTSTDLEFSQDAIEYALELLKPEGDNRCWSIQKRNAVTTLRMLRRSFALARRNGSHSTTAGES